MATGLINDPRKIYDTSDARDPLASDDKSGFYGIGCRWVNTVSMNLFVLTDDSVGSAVWDPIPGMVSGSALPNPLPSGNLPDIPLAKIPQINGVRLPAMKTYGFTGNNGAGPVTVTGANVDDVVFAIWEATGSILDVSTSFEHVVSIVDQLQQEDATDFSAKKFVVMLTPRSTTPLPGPS